MEDLNYSCAGKFRYEEASKARNAADALRRNSGELVQAYHCEDCCGFHLGHGKKKRGGTGKKWAGSWSAQPKSAARQRKVSRSKQKRNRGRSGRRGKNW